MTGRELLRLMAAQVCVHSAMTGTRLAAPLLALQLGYSAAAVGVLLTQAMPPLVALFEVVSALGTVGLTTGGTSLLDEVGKVLIIICMFMGRVGPLTLFLLLNEARASAGPGLPEENVPVG